MIFSLQMCCDLRVQSDLHITMECSNWYACDVVLVYCIYSQNIGFRHFTTFTNSYRQLSTVYKNCSKWHTPDFRYTCEGGYKVLCADWLLTSNFYLIGRTPFFVSVYKIYLYCILEQEVKMRISNIYVHS